MLSADQKKRYILQILAGERSQSDVAREAGYSRQAVSQWLKLYHSEGENGIRKRRGRPKIKRLPEKHIRRLKTFVTTRTPAETGIEGDFTEWSYEAVRQLILRETGVKLTYRFVAEYLDEWGLPHPMARQDQVAPNPRPAGRPKTVPQPAAPAPAIIEEDPEEFSLDEYQAGITEARKNLRSGPNPAHGQRTGRHARQRAAPTRKKRKNKHRRKPR